MTAFDHPVRIVVESDSESHNVVMMHDHYYYSSDNDREQPTQPVRDQLINLSSAFTYTSFDDPVAVAKELSTMPKTIEKPFSPVSTTEDFFDSQQDDPYHRTLQEFLQREKFHSEMRKRFEAQTGLDMKIITRTTRQHHHPNYYQADHNSNLLSKTTSLSSSSSSSSADSASSSLLSVSPKTRSEKAQQYNRIRFKPMQKPLLLEYKPDLIKKYRKMENQPSPKGSAVASPNTTLTSARSNSSSSSSSKIFRHKGKAKWTKLPVEQAKFSLEPSTSTAEPIRVHFGGEMVTVDENLSKSLEESIWI